MSAKRKHRSTNEYLRYLKREASNEERHSFERDLQADPFEMEALEGMEQIPADELEEDLLSIHATLHKRLKRRKRRNLYYAAASVASLLIVGTIFLNIYEINPKTASESIPKDESFLHEDVTGQPGEELRMEEPELAEKSGLEKVTVSDEEAELEIKQVVQTDDDTDAPAPAEREVHEMEVVPEEALAVEEKTDHEDRAMQVAGVVSDEAEELPSQAAMAPAVEPAVEAVEAEEPAVEPAEAEERAEAAKPEEREFDELVIKEAQPRRSQKKGRSREAPALMTTQRVQGIVVSSEDMEPLPGASIMVKGSDSGMVTDMEGRFSLITDQQAQPTVIASYVGMETEEYQLDGNSDNRVVMKPDMATLSEVVVIGYDAEKSVYATGAVQKVKLDDETTYYKGAEPEGGLEAYRMYIEEQIRYPSGVTTRNREVVVLKFDVGSDGSIARILTLRSPGDPFTEEAIRLLNEGPSWKPAVNESGHTDDVVRMRIVFKQQ